MADILAQKTFTVKKLVNGKTLTFVLKTDKALTQIFSRDSKTFAPDYAASALTLTPMLLVSGKNGDQTAHLSNLNWRVLKQDGSAATQALTAGTGLAKKLAANLTDCTGLKITCEATYTDPVSMAAAQVVASVEITKMENAGANILASLYMPDGDTFDNAGKALKIHCDLMRGGDIDTSNVTYTWYQLRNGVWTKLETSNANGISGFTSNEITVPASAVVNVGIFKCIIKDTDTASATANKEVFAIGTLYDGSDPYEIDVFQPNGDNVAEGGSLLHWFKIRQGASYITDAVILGAHNMRVWRFAANNAIDTTWGTSGYKACTKDAPNAHYSLEIAYSDLLSASQAFCVELY